MNGELLFFASNIGVPLCIQTIPTVRPFLIINNWDCVRTSIQCLQTKISVCLDTFRVLRHQLSLRLREKITCNRLSTFYVSSTIHSIISRLVFIIQILEPILVTRAPFFRSFSLFFSRPINLKSLYLFVVSPSFLIRFSHGRLLMRLVVWIFRYFLVHEHFKIHLIGEPFRRNGVNHLQWISF